MKQKLKQRPKSEAQAFLGELRGGQEFLLKHIARALHKATNGRQEALLTRLKKGEMIASCYWPNAGAPTEIPASLWSEIQPSQFRVRAKRNDSWRTWSYSLPAETLLRHFASPLLHRLKDSDITGPEREEVFNELNSMVSCRMASANVCVTLPNARLFAEKHLGGPSSKGPGRPRELAADILLLEAVRRLEFKSQLPSQKKLIGDLHKWWTSHSDWPPCSESWVEQQVKQLWQSLRRRDAAT
jgi:hypothetical protein